MFPQLSCERLKTYFRVYPLNLHRVLLRAFQSALIRFALVLTGPNRFELVSKSNSLSNNLLIDLLPVVLFETKGSLVD